MTDRAQQSSPISEGLQRCLTQIAELPEEKRGHFQYLLLALLNCYTTEQTRALVLVSEAPLDRERVSLIAVNANQDETHELIDTLCVFRQMDHADPAALN